MLTEIEPSDWVRALRIVEAQVDNLAGLANIPGAADSLRALCRRELASARAPVVFRYLGEDDAMRAVYEVGRGDEVRRVTTRKRGVFTVWWLLHNPGDAWKPEHLSRPGALTPADSARTMVRDIAAKQFMAWGMPELAAAAKACHKCGEHMHMERPHDALQVITR
jgi:hypothetical protein